MISLPATISTFTELVTISIAFFAPIMVAVVVPPLTVVPCSLPALRWEPGARDPSLQVKSFIWGGGLKAVVTGP